MRPVLPGGDRRRPGSEDGGLPGPQPLPTGASGWSARSTRRWPGQFGGRSTRWPVDSVGRASRWLAGRRARVCRVRRFAAVGRGPRVGRPPGAHFLSRVTAPQADPDGASRVGCPLDPRAPGQERAPIRGTGAIWAHLIVRCRGPVRCGTPPPSRRGWGGHFTRGGCTSLAQGPYDRRRRRPSGATAGDVPTTRVTSTLWAVFDGENRPNGTRNTTPAIEDGSGNRGRPNGAPTGTANASQPGERRTANGARRGLCPHFPRPPDSCPFLAAVPRVKRCFARAKRAVGLRLRRGAAAEKMGSRGTAHVAKPANRRHPAHCRTQGALGSRHHRHSRTRGGR